jgi:hypothetical protein
VVIQHLTLKVGWNQHSAHGLSRAGTGD